MRLGVVLFGMVLVAGASHQVSAALVEDFDGGGNTAFSLTNSSGEAPAVLSGGPSGDFVRITNLSGNNNNTIAFDENPTATGPAPNGLTMQFDFRMTDDEANAAAGGCCGSAADGLGIGLFETSTYGSTGGVNPTSMFGGNWERPAFPDAFAVGLDIFQNIDVVTLNLDGAQIAAADVQSFLDLNSNVFHRAMLEIKPDGGNASVDMTVIEDVFGGSTSHTVFSGQNISGLSLSTVGNYRLIAGGRTGGAFTDGDFDNINVSEVIPEPTSLALLSLGGLALLRRRRRAA